MSMLNRIANRLRLMVSRGVVEIVSDSLKMQGLQVSLLSDEVSDDVERFQDYGCTSVPFTGAETIVVSVGANRSHLVALRVDDRRHRPKDLNEGDVCLFTDNGERVYLDRDADVVRIGGKAGAEFLLLGTLFRTRQAVLNTALNVGFTALGVGFTAVGVGFTALGVGWTATGLIGAALVVDNLTFAPVAPTTAPLLPAWNTAIGVAVAATATAATACGVASTACTTAANAITAFENGGGATDYKSTKAATVA